MHTRPRRIGDVAMRLALVGVRLEELDVEAARRELTEHATIVGGGAIPVRRHQARAEHRQSRARLHVPVLARNSRASGASSAMMVNSSSTRCAQLWRFSMVARALRPS